jgi:hypothetical protein
VVSIGKCLIELNNVTVLSVFVVKLLPTTVLASSSYANVKSKGSFDIVELFHH